MDRGWFPLLTSPIVSLKKSTNPLHKKIFQTTLANYSALDFTEAYHKIWKDTKPYPLTHSTAGIYSDYTHIKIQSGADEKIYSNTFHIYVLPKLNAVTDPATKTIIDLDVALNAASRLYCENTACSKNGKLQLNFANYSVWDVIGKNGLWAVWMSGDGIIASEPVAVRTGSGGTVTSSLRIPADIRLSSGYLIVYEDVMNGYLLHSGKSKVEVLKSAFLQRIRTQDRRYPVIAVKLSGLQRTTIPLLKPTDTDKDGIADSLDAFPSDKRYAYDTDKDGMPDEWESQYGLNVFANDAASDLNNNGISNLDEFKANTDPQHFKVAVKAGDKQVTLTWAKPLNTASQSICWASNPITDSLNCFTATPDGSDSTLLENPTSPVVIKNLVNGKLYYFVVFVEDSAGKFVESKLLTATPGKPYTINDTGITTCSIYGQNGLPCPVEGYPGQDAQSGRDVSQNDPGNGHAGFNFSKISSTGAVLAASATSWNCVKDTVTGLVWEVKTDDGGLHDKDWRYRWYEPDASKNGGFAGYPNNGSCGGTSQCDTKAYVNAVNAAGWCGYKDWRMPTVDELSGIASLDRYNPSIDTAYFPNTQSDYWYWSSSPVASNSNLAWIVYFYDGNDDWSSKDFSHYVRLVRGGQ